MTQIEAKKFCEEEQEVPARLVEIDSAEENSAIIAEIKRQKTGQNIEFWLGITDRHSEGHWVLESSTKSVVFTDWRSGEPNNANSDEHCAYINSQYEWNDIPCNSKTDTVDRNRWMRTALCEKRQASQSGSCLLKIPGYDTSLDLSSWGKEDSYFEAEINDPNGKRRKFQLNLCNPVQNGSCTNN